MDNSSQAQQAQQAQKAMIDALITPWYQAVENPAKAQEEILVSILKTYNQTEYGKKYGSEKVSSLEDFRNAFPIQTFDGFRPWIDQVIAGNTHALLSEEPVSFGYTKGTTGKSKIFPITPTHVKSFQMVSQRGIMNYVVQKKDFQLFSSYRLNLTSSGKVGTIKVGDREMMYGFSLAVFAKLLENIGMATSNVVPSQNEMDALPPEPTKENWEKRYEYAFQKARNLEVTHIFTSPNIVVEFARYLKRVHGVLPKDIWKIRYYGSGAFPHTYSRYAPLIYQYYGKDLNIREAYMGTEWMYGNQIDDIKAWVPLYDQLLLEVQTPTGIKMLHEMNPGEIGSLIISTHTLPRYRLKDLILAYQAPYFRCIGRENARLDSFAFARLKGKSAFHLSNTDTQVTWRH